MELIPGDVFTALRKYKLASMRRRLDEGYGGLV